MTANRSYDLSIFQLLRHQLADDLPMMRCTKTTLVHISHILEDMVLTHHLPALIFTGFQEASHWRSETKRYRALASVARQVCIFAGRDLPPESEANALHVKLAAGDPLRQEWFLAILAEPFSVVLCGQDRAIPVNDEGRREFDTVLTFEPERVNAVLDVLAQAIATYRPEKLADLQTARATYPVSKPALTYLTRFFTGIIEFEEDLNQTLFRSDEQQRVINRRLRENEERFRLVSETASDAILMIDAGQTVTYANPAAVRLFGGTPTSLVGQSLLGLLPDFVPLSVPGGVYETRAFHQSGDLLPVSISQGEFTQGNQQVRVLIIRDISERKRLEAMQLQRERMRLALEKERDLGALRNQFLAMVSHEFRTPLATILSSAEMLDRYHERMTADRRAESFDTIRGQVKHLESMLDDVMLITRVQSGTFRVHTEPIDLRVFISEMERLVSETFGRTHQLVISRDVMSALFHSDERLLRHILNNLFSNAAKYSPDRSQINFSVTWDGDEAVFCIADSGIGIPQADQAHILEGFYRAENASFTPGTGLGLKIVADCVGLLGGSVNFTSQEGVGTTFIVSLPSNPPRS